MNTSLKRTARNFRVMLILQPLTTLLDKMTEPYQWIYTRVLGADVLQLGYVNSLGGVANAVIAVPAGWWVDRYSLKKAMIITLSLHLLVPLLYAIAWGWVMVIPAVALSITTMYLTWNISSILIADSTSSDKRGSGFGLIQLLSQIAGILSPLIAGYIIATLGGISIENIRPLFYMQVIGFSVLGLFAYKTIRELPRSEKAGRKYDIISDFREVFEAGTGLKRFILVRCLGVFCNSLVGPFAMVFATEVKGANALDIGAMATALMVVAVVTAIPMGRFSDRFGRKRVIYIQELSECVRYSLLVIAPPYRPDYLILAWAIAGISMGGMGWSTIMMEMVPSTQRGRWTGISQFFSGLVMVPASLLGGLLWMRFDPTLPFTVYVITILFIMIPIFATVPETLKHQGGDAHH